MGMVCQDYSFQKGLPWGDHSHIRKEEVDSRIAVVVAVAVVAVVVVAAEVAAATAVDYDGGNHSIFLD